MCYNHRPFKIYLQIKLEPTNLCKFKTKFIFIYIFTNVESFTKRQLIRDTWANKSLNLFNFNLVFIIGKTNHLNKTIDKLLILEQYKYNDLIQGNFIDAYRNLSYKSLIAWKWIKDKCNHASYILKLDDDVFLNIFKLKQILNNNNNIFKSTSNSFICNVHPRLDKHYPPYCLGVGVIITADIISKLYLKAFEIKMFWIDDVYVGILGKYINAQIENIDGLYSNDRNRSNDILFISGTETTEDVNEVWNLINNSS
jgi:hypothetical protein